MELTRANRRRLASLASPKGRRENALFMAEGTKCVLETINSFNIETIIATPAWIELHARSLPPDAPLTEARPADIAEISALSTPTEVIAVYHIPDTPSPRPAIDRLDLALDRIQDPGNLGTIIRIASWMGINNIYCSRDTADIYNPKVIQATMGAIARVNVSYLDLPPLLLRARRAGIPVYGTFLDGSDIYQSPLTPGGIIVMGNEGNGISPAVASLVDRRLLIPSYPPDAPTVESLNVAVATAITVAEFRHRLSCV